MRKDPFPALADPTRRAILDLLRVEQTLTAGSIAAEFPSMSRPAVSKHLGVLRDAELVRVRESGREWHYTLDPHPLADVYENWFANFVPLWDDSLGRLKNTVERNPAGRSAKGRRPSG